MKRNLKEKPQWHRTQAMQVPDFKKKRILVTSMISENCPAERILFKQVTNDLTQLCRPKLLVWQKIKWMKK